MLSRYSRWDGSQSLPDFDADDLLAAMADDLLADGDPAARSSAFSDADSGRGQATRSRDFATSWSACAASGGIS